jgi:hypothetical protein
MLTQLISQLGAIKFFDLYTLKSDLLPIALTLTLHIFLLRLFDPPGFAALPASLKVESAAIGVLLTVLGATLLSSLHSLMMELLEGKHWAQASGIGRHWKARRGLLEEIAVARRERGLLTRLQPGGASDSRIESRISHGEPIGIGEIKSLGGASFSGALDGGVKNLLAPLSEEQLNYAADWWYAKELETQNKLNFVYPVIPVRKPGEHFAAAMVAPTRFGNIGRTMRAYSLTRYQLDLEIFWTRLQRTIQNANDHFSQSLTRARADLNFAVAMTFLTASLMLYWTLSLAIQDGQTKYFALTSIAGLGPVVAYAFYRLACRNYIVFADITRTAVDVYRFHLLKDLNIPKPASTEAEKSLWLGLGRWIGHGVEISFTYKEIP